jgi:hypothetical protein
MSDIKRRITFNDKEDSTILNPDSKYVLTASNINEIKEVVNNLSDELDNRLRFNHIFKYCRFNIPNSLKTDCDYSFEFEISDDKNFENNVTTITLKDNFSKFEKFEKGQWIVLTSDTITKNDINKTIKFDISNIVSDTNKCYFGRYKWINKTINEEQEWQGFCLSVFEYNDQDFESSILKDVYIEGRTSLNEKESNIQYEVYGRDETGNLNKLTNSVTFSTLFGNGTFSKNKLSLGNFHEVKNEIIVANFQYNNVNYKAFLNIIINPVLLEKIELIKNFNRIQRNETQNFIVKAYYSDSTIMDVTSSCEKVLSLGNCELNSNVIFGKGAYDSFGYLKVSYADKDFPELENKEVTTFINYSIPKFKSFDINFPNELKGLSSDQLTYSVTLNYDNGMSKNITNNVQIICVDSPELQCQNGLITFKKDEVSAKKMTSVIFTYFDEEYSSLNYTEIRSVLLNPLIMEDINIKFYKDENEIFESNENSVINYKIFGKYNDGSEIEIRSNYEINLLTSSKCSINKTKKTITIKSHEFSNLSIFSISYKFGNKVLKNTGYLGILPISISEIKVSSNILNNDPTTEWKTKYSSSKEIYFTGIYSDGTEESISDNVKIELAFGNPNLVKDIQNNIISFNEPTLISEAICFIATYQNPEFLSETKTTHFVITVLKN